MDERCIVKTTKETNHNTNRGSLFQERKKKRLSRFGSEFGGQSDGLGNFPSKPNITKEVSSNGIDSLTYHFRSLKEFI